MTVARLITGYIASAISKPISAIKDGARDRLLLTTPNNGYLLLTTAGNGYLILE